MQAARPPGNLAIIVLGDQKQPKKHSLDLNFRRNPSRFYSPPLGFSFSADETKRLEAGPGEGTPRDCPSPCIIQTRAGEK